ncbi:MAG: hypothetical protein NUV96_00225 [Candidatus Colwellbacteria bacterium]|nr:hypothetical protein [Candidatus Colwellbacteria bacterium]
MLARRRSRNQSSLRRYIVLGVSILAAGSAVYLIWFSPIFVIQAVEIQGGEAVTAVDFNEAIGKNIIFYRPSFNLENAPQAASIKVDKKYFKRTIEFTFIAKERYAIWCFQLKGECFWIDASGSTFAQAPDIKGPLILRLVRDESERELALGEKVLEDIMFQNLKAAFVLLEELDIPVREFKIENLKFKEAVALTSGPTIYFSLQDDPSFGRAVVEQLRGSGEWNAVNYLDLRVPGRAYYAQ